jgi:protein tyrosine phosphatase
MTFCSYFILQLQTGEVRRVSHLNFTSWPDHDTPSQPDDLLTFISYMRHIHRSGPIITHCSAGIGRSGTLICIDVVLGLISQDLEVSTRKTLNEHMTRNDDRTCCLIMYLSVVYSEALGAVSMQCHIHPLVCRCE